MSVTTLDDEVWPAYKRAVRVNECEGAGAARQAVRLKHGVCGLLEAALDGSKQMIVNKMAGPTTNHHVISNDRMGE